MALAGVRFRLLDVPWFIGSQEARKQVGKPLSGLHPDQWRADVRGVAPTGQSWRLPRQPGPGFRRRHRPETTLSRHHRGQCSREWVEACARLRV